MKLISMTDFVIENENMVKQTESEMSKDLFKLSQYANFLKQPLKLEVFVPCDDDGNVIKLPNACICINLCNLCKKYEQAKEKVLFEGFEYKKELRNSGGNYTHFVTNNKIEIYVQWGGFYVFGKTENKIENIEDLIKFDLTLTQSVIKKLGL
jgi:hypothetical protein